MSCCFVSWPDSGASPPVRTFLGVNPKCEANVNCHKNRKVQCILGGLFSMSDVEPNHYVWFVTHCSREELGVINKSRASHISFNHQDAGACVHSQGS